MNKNAKFLSTVGTDIKNAILSAIAKHYGITTSEALEEVSDENAEDLCEYLTGSIRSTTHLYMVKMGF